MSQTTLLSFHGKQETKDYYLQRIKAHELADEIVQGTTWEKGKGCAVGCTLHQYNHRSYETELGITRILAHLEDRIFEGLPNSEAKTFPFEFLSSIPVGKDLTPVWKKFLVWLLVDEKEGTIQYAKKNETKAVIQKVADTITLSLTEEISEADYKILREQAWSAAAAAAAAAAYAYAAAAAAAYAADAAAAAAAADAYAYAAAAAAAYAADAADAAAAAAAYAADADAAAYAADARTNKYRAMRVKLIELLKAA